MNRREFTLSLTAAATAPAVPVLVPVPPLAATAPRVALPPGAYLWADFIARAQGRITQAMLQRHLRLDPRQAAHLAARLVADGVVSAPGAAGIARATAPLRTPAATAGAGDPLSGGLRRLARRALDTADAQPADAPVPAPGAPSDTDLAEAAQE